ncbi:MAG: succinylglutamate desuccinylase/aspartoacylase family protein [Marinicaulis sp.]|nr:succinylglutamate desuccinylase/aspartoacylase family protein [Marinicaulis sp.]
MAQAKSTNDPFRIAGVEVAPGERCTIDIPISRLANHTSMSLAAEIFHGREPGPVLFVSAAVHGDEIIGVEIIRRIAQSSQLKRIRGTVMLIPIVNAYGFIANSRYLPDRRDLNRSFPGSATGSLASQLANTFMAEIVGPADYGIDLHSGAVHRSNLPQIRAQIVDKKTKALAAAFGAPVVLNAGLREGSLRQAASDKDCKVIVYEAGEALRFDEKAILIGIKGVFNVMRHLEMIPPSKKIKAAAAPTFSQSSHWLRATTGGVMRCFKSLGQNVAKDEKLATISDPFGENEEIIYAKSDGVIIGRVNLPIVNRGDALFHVASVFNPDATGAKIEALGEKIQDDPLFDGGSVI